MAFELEVAKWVSGVKVDMDQAFQGLAIELARRIIMRTPVSSGEARGAWQAGVNAVPSGDTPLDPTGAATLARVTAVIRTARAGDVIFLVNSAGHIHALEFGKSDQAPAGMVRVTLVEAQAIARGVVARLRQ